MAPTFSSDKTSCLGQGVVRKQGLHYGAPFGHTPLTGAILLIVDYRSNRVILSFFQLLNPALHLPELIVGSAVEIARLQSSPSHLKAELTYEFSC